MIIGRFGRVLPILLVAGTLAGCVTIAPAASPTASPTLARTASPAPTASPTAPPTTPPTTPPTQPLTLPPTAPATIPPTSLPTLPPTEQPTQSPTGDTLDPNQQARYGSLDPLESNFEPDPMAVQVVSGGPVDTSYLGGDECAGFAEPNPDYEVHYNAGVQDLLRFYFVADTPGDDATMVVNDAASNWLCSDDSFGSSDPAIDFSPPQSGWYDIWIGSYSPDDFISGTLYITELTTNHP